MVTATRINIMDRQRKGKDNTDRTATGSTGRMWKRKEREMICERKNSERVGEVGETRQNTIKRVESDLMENWWWKEGDAVEMRIEAIVKDKSIVWLTVSESYQRDTLARLADVAWWLDDSLIFSANTALELLLLLWLLFAADYPALLN